MPDPAVRIEIPASGEYLAVLRAAATGLAAGLQFTYEEIDDLRIAVDEACAQLLARRGGEGTLRVAYVIAGSALEIEVTLRADGRAAAAPDGTPVVADRDSFSWQILRALTDEVDERVDDDGLHLAFRKQGGPR